MQPAAVVPAPARPGAPAPLDDMRKLEAVAVRLGRRDLAQRTHAAIARIARPSAVVCVVGEFKAGKSSLINALVGASVCPVDDDVATSALTLVHYAEERTANLRSRVDGAAAVEAIPTERIADVVTEAGNPANRRGIERLDVGVPSALLRQGLALVDTPGSGGLRAGQAAATLAFLPYTDGLIFASSGLVELSGPEIAFLRQASELCPVVLFALTKVDIAPHWRRIAALDERHLQDAGLDFRVLPVASRLRGLGAEETAGGERAGEDGIDALSEALLADVVRPAKERAVERGRAEAHTHADQLVAAVRTQLALLEDPPGPDDAVVRLDEARGSLEHLRGPGARWNQLVADRMADLASEATVAFRTALRDLSRVVDTGVDALETPEQWEAFGHRLSGDTASAVSKVFGNLEQGMRAARVEVAELLREEAAELPTALPEIDVERFWAPMAFEEPGRQVAGLAGQAMSGVRGGYGGLFMFSLLGRLLPAGAAAVFLSSPVSLGIGVIFAGRSILDAKKRKLEARRQAAKAAARRFLDDVQFEVGNHISDVLRTLQRQLRDEFAGRVTDLSRTLGEAVERAKGDVTRSQAERERRIGSLRAELAELATIVSSIESGT